MPKNWLMSWLANASPIITRNFKSWHANIGLIGSMGAPISSCRHKCFLTCFQSDRALCIHFGHSIQGVLDKKNVNRDDSWSAVRGSSVQFLPMNSKRKARVDRPRAGQFGVTLTNLLFPSMVHRLSKKEHFHTKTKRRCLPPYKRKPSLHNTNLTDTLFLTLLNIFEKYANHTFRNRMGEKQTVFQTLPVCWKSTELIWKLILCTYSNKTSTVFL